MKEFVDALCAEEAGRQEFREWLWKFDQCAGRLTVFDLGTLSLNVSHGEINLVPDLGMENVEVGWLGVYADALQEWAEGRLNPIEAYFRGELVTETGRETLEHLYACSVWLLGIVQESEAAKRILEKFGEKVRGARPSSLVQ